MRCSSTVPSIPPTKRRSTSTRWSLSMAGGSLKQLSRSVAGCIYGLIRPQPEDLPNFVHPWFSVSVKKDLWLVIGLSGCLPLCQKTDLPNVGMRIGCRPQLILHYFFFPIKRILILHYLTRLKQNNAMFYLYHGMA